MGFVERQQASREPLPKDLPPAMQVASNHPDGALYETDDKQRFKLRHARWVKVIKRDRKQQGTAKRK